MSRQNKVNPGQYTQRGRLAQDDAAREMMRQQASIASQNHPQQDEGPWVTTPPAAPVGTDEARAEQEQEAAPAVAKKPTGKARAAKSAKSAASRSPRPVRKAALARSVVRRPAAAKKTAKKTKGSARRAARR